MGFKVVKDFNDKRCTFGRTAFFYRPLRRGAPTPLTYGSDVGSVGSVGSVGNLGNLMILIGVIKTPKTP